MDLVRIIDEALERRGLSPAAASRAALNNDSFIKNIKAGSSPSVANLEKLADVLGLELYFGPPRHMADVRVLNTSTDGSPKDARPLSAVSSRSPGDRLTRIEDALSNLTEQLALIANRPGAPTGPYSPVPLYDVRAAAGGGAAVEFEEIETTLSFRRDWLLANGLTPSQCGLIRVIGDSMSPTLEEDDVMLIDFTARDLRPRHIYAIRDDGDLLVKRVVSDLGDPVELGSDNPAYPPFALDNGAAVVGRVVWSARTYRKTPSAFSIVR